MSPFGLLKFYGGSQIFVKSVHPCLWNRGLDPVFPIMYVCSQITKFNMNWRNSGEGGGEEVFRRMTLDLKTSELNYQFNYLSWRKFRKHFFPTDYPLLMTRLKQNSIVVTWQYRRVSTCDTTFHFRVTFHYLAFQTQVFNTVNHVNEKCYTRDI